MATATVQLNMTKAAFVDSRLPSTNTPLSSFDTILLTRNFYANQISYLFMGFEALPASLKWKKLIRVSYVGVQAPYQSDKFYVSSNKSDFNKNTLTYDNMPEDGMTFTYSVTQGGSPSFAYYYRLYEYMGNTSVNTRDKSEYTKSILKTSSLRVFPTQASGEYSFILASGERDNPAVPYIMVEYDDGADLTSQITPTGKTSGYINPKNEQRFSWDFVSHDANYVCLGDFAQASATFYWKEHSESTYNSISASGSTKSVTVPANTFPANSQIDWYVAGTDDAGTTTQSSVYTLSTSDTTAYATIVSPINTVEDGSGPITFRWNLSNAYGNDPSIVNLWWKLPSEDNQSWHTIVSSTDPITEYTTPGGYFPAGEIQWLVHAYNQDNVRGPDSQGSFICVAAPEAPDGIASDGVPYATITWQCSGQQAYRILIDGKDYGVHFGTVKSFTMGEPLSDGEHTVTVYAQGNYGLWSQPGTETITIANQAGDAIALTGVGGLDATLAWTTAASDPEIYIYRDDVKIGHTRADLFVDRMALGSHSYYVINKLPGGYYTKSNIVTLAMETDESMIASFPPGGWLNIRLSENSSIHQSFSYQRTVSTRHFFGANYPVLELSPFEDETASYDTAFQDPAAAEEFESLRGKLVCIKSRMGVVFVGVMNVMRKTVKPFFVSYSFSVKRVHWEDYIDDTLT